MTKYLTICGAIAGATLTSLGLTATSAQAAWTTAQQVHGGKTLVCKVPLADGQQRVRLRLDNSNAQHTHVSGMSRQRGGQTTQVDVRTAAGNVSATESLVWRRGDVLVTGIGEVTGEGMGSQIGIGQISRC